MSMGHPETTDLEVPYLTEWNGFTIFIIDPNRPPGSIAAWAEADRMVNA
jgi:hypothetical protein